MSEIPEKIAIAEAHDTTDAADGEALEDAPIASHDEVPNPLATGQSAKTSRDMQNVTDVYEERPTVDIRQLEKKTFEDKLTAERYLDEAGGDLTEALKAWVKVPFGVMDYDTIYGHERGPLIAPIDDSLADNKISS